MFIRQGDPLFSKSRYQRYRGFIILWLAICVISIYFWSSTGLMLKIILFAILGLTLPDSLWDLFKSYNSYKQNWTEINKKTGLRHNSNGENIISESRNEIKEDKNK